jgi:hypothetical protein
MLSLTCTRRRLKCNPSISHRDPLLRNLGVITIPEVDVGHVFPGRRWSCVHAERSIGELDLGLIGLDVPLLLGLGS